MHREIKDILAELESEQEFDFDHVECLIDELESTIDSSDVGSIKSFLHSDTNCFTRALVARVALRSLGEEFISFLAMVIVEMREGGYQGEDFEECLEGFVLQSSGPAFSSYKEMLQSADHRQRGAALAIGRSLCMEPFREEVMEGILETMEDGDVSVAMLAIEAAFQFEYERVREGLYRVTEKSLERGDQVRFRHVLRGIAWNRDEGDLMFLRTLESKFRDPALRDVIFSIEYGRSTGLRRIWMFVVRHLMP